MTDDLDKARRATDPNEPIKQVIDKRSDLDERRAGGRWPDADVERAQPGDVIGIERSGETTELGDTAESEDDRRRDAQKDAPR